MTYEQQALSRPPKLRSSCDGCGAVKGKCDRQHPECGRCMAHGIKCTYGISKKVGKPRRDKSLNPINHKPSNSIGTNSSSASDKMSTSTNTSTITNTHIALDSTMSYTWENTHKSNEDDDSGILDMDYAFPDSISGTELYSSFLPAVAFGDWTGSDNLDSVLASVHHTDSYEKLDLHASDLHGRSTSDIPTSRGMNSAVGGTDHNCYREAHELLGTLLFTMSDLTMKHVGSLNVSPSLPAELHPTSAPAQVPTSYFDGTVTGSHSMSLDQVLLLNRKATQRLAPLLACPCAASPYLMMLYASLVSAILTRCEHAAGSSSTCSPMATPGGSVSMARISVGAFSVDDPKLQSALNIQLLAGELRTVAALIDTIASYQCDTKVTTERTGGTNVPRLYQNLAMWLRNEHAKVTDIIGNRLRELNT